MQSPPNSTPAPADRPSRFPLFFELLVWGLYVGLYKYAHYLEQAAHLQRPDRAAFPYPQLLLFAGATSLYLVPCYRWLVPVLLRHRRYAPLVGVGLLPVLWWGFKLNLLLAAGTFARFADPPALAAFCRRWPRFTSRSTGLVRAGFLASPIPTSACSLPTRWRLAVWPSCRWRSTTSGAGAASNKPTWRCSSNS